MQINNLEYSFQSFFQIFIQNCLNHPLTLVKNLFGYAHRDISFIDLQTTKHCNNELTEFMDAYIEKILHTVRQKHLRNYTA